jgi:hypothetical protein
MGFLGKDSKLTSKQPAESGSADDFDQEASFVAAEEKNSSPTDVTEARALLESLKPKSESDFTDVALSHKASLLAQAFRGRLPTSIELKNITEELGVEIATALFWRTLQESNAHGGFAREVRGVDFSKWDKAAARASGIEVVVIASNLFQSGRQWGDHVEMWRAWARDLGFTTDMIETNPRMSVAANARVIFEYLARSPQRARVIVSYGQGSAEFRYLMHRRVNRDPRDPIPEEIAQIKGWINVCGAYGGSSTSRFIQENRLRRLLMRLRMKVAGRNPITLAETAASFPLWRRPMPLLPGMEVVSVVAVPYRDQIPAGLQGYYDLVAKDAPNDGVVSVSEATAHHGFVLPVAGMTHQAEKAKLEPMLKRTLAVMARRLGVGVDSSQDELKLI